MTYVYDYRNRRVQRTVYTYSSGAWAGTPTRQTRYLWDGWLVLAEYDGLGQGLPLMRLYTWGLDLSGQRGGPQSGRYMLEAAGGIGGLLATLDPDDDGDPEDPTDVEHNFVYTYDANGNVGQLVDLSYSGWSLSDVLAARYEYSPFGEVTRTSGWYADVNRYRFSTKPFDEDTDLGYWGERWYWSAAGRWINRDPIGEPGGANLYAYAVNSPLMRYDPYGYLSLIPTTPLIPPGLGVGALIAWLCPKQESGSDNEWDIPDCSHSIECQMSCMLADTAWGSAICVTGDDGIKRPCTCDCWEARAFNERNNPGATPNFPKPPFGPKAAPIIQRCTRKEEQRDAKNLDCYEGPAPDGGDFACPGDIENLTCIRDALKAGECGGNATCEADLKSRAFTQTQMCSLYGSGIYEGHSDDSYTRKCPEEQRQKCGDLWAEINEILGTPLQWRKNRNP